MKMALLILLYVIFSLVNEKADWPVARQNKARWESQLKILGVKKSRVRERCQQATQEAKHTRGQVKT